MYDLLRLRYVAANYYMIQGLRFAPLGLLFLLWGAMRFDWVVLPTGLADFVLDWGYLVAMLIYPLLHFYYERTFGRAGFECLPRGVGWGTAARVVGTIIAVPVGTMLLETWLGTTVRLFGLLLAGTLLWYYWPKRQFALHYVAMGAGFGLICVASTLMGMTLSKSHSAVGGIYLFMLGAVFVVGGVFDHLLLVRTFKPLPSEDGGGNGAV